MLSLSATFNLVQLIMVSLGQSNEHNTIYVKNGSRVILQCKFKSSPSSIVWLGPPSSTIYSIGEQMNTETPKYRRLSVTIDHISGIFNLTISNFTSEDTGLYYCNSLIDEVTLYASFDVKLQVKPSILSKTTALRYQIELGQAQDIVILVESFEQPSVSWICCRTDGKLGHWEIHNEQNNTFRLSSVILLDEQFVNNATVRVRNQAGNVDVTIGLYLEEVVIDMVNPKLTCNVSDTVTMACYIDVNDIEDWRSEWRHYRRGILIRTLESEQEGNKSSASLNFCDYKDAGNYFCVWKKNGREIRNYLELFVQSEPVVADKMILMTNISMLTLRVNFLSYESPKPTIWFNGKELKDSISQKSISVSMEIYGEQLREQGYQTEMTLQLETNLTLTSYSCQLMNSFGTTEVSFLLTDLLTAINGTKHLTKASAFVTTESEAPSTQNLFVENNESHVTQIKTVHLIVYGAGLFAVIVVFVTTVLIVLRYFYNKGTAQINSNTLPTPVPAEEQKYESLDLAAITPITSGPYQSIQQNAEYTGIPDGPYESIALH